MKDQELYKYTFIDDNNNEVDYEVLATFHNKNDKKIYYVMTDNTKSPNGKLNISVFYNEYKEEGKEILTDEKFNPLTNEKELDMVLESFKNLQKEL